MCYNSLQSQDESVKSRLVGSGQSIPAARRSHPKPGQHRQGLAIQEQQVLIGVTEARAKVSSIQLTPEL